MAAPGCETVVAAPHTDKGQPDDAMSLQARKSGVQWIAWDCAAILG